MKYTILFIILLLVPQVNAWKAETHQNAVEYVYYSMPLEIQQKLNLSQMKEGSVMPDAVFKDFTKHHYPDSLIEARKWLNNNTDISLNLGIASHYILDSYDAPHYIKNEDYNQHTAFESQVVYIAPNLACKNYNLKIEDISKGAKNSKDWYPWLKTKDKTIPQREVNQATEVLFSIVLDKMNATCINRTEVTEVPYFTKTKIIICCGILLIGLYFLKR